jgi:hypothetical protein
MENLVTPATIDCAENSTLKSDAGDEYLIQVGFPRGWFTTVPETDKKDVPVMYKFLGWHLLARFKIIPLLIGKAVM